MATSASVSKVTGTPAFQTSGQRTRGGSPGTVRLSVWLLEAQRLGTNTGLWPVSSPRSDALGHTHTAVRAVSEGLRRACAFLRAMLWHPNRPSALRQPSSMCLPV